MARIRCSIEMEPRTLNEGQLNHAREAAVDMVQKIESNEASNVFIEGLRPVVSVKEMEQIVQMEGRQQLTDDCKLVDCNDNTAAHDQVVFERTYDCACTMTPSEDDRSPEQKTKIKEPLSAPF